MLKAVSVALALLIPAPALAGELYFVRPDESQYIKYEIELKQFFTNFAAEDAGKYLRTSDSQRRRDGQLLCTMLTAYPTEEYLTSVLERHRLLYDDPQKLRSEIAYSLGVAAAAIDAMCTEHRASLMDFFENYNATGTSSQNR
ncbi:hypothetical protein NIES592_08080 [Fischerella major NIES-592]|uniref:Uncharacterized protein n=1 Tax=Fischerella major NIES-592 TaxID=210994 RepID=A0A1U7H1M9_9CYAN|nr:hypothetical protein [Fischerella major]OKH14825.1 hypothetical protein NIES592_08080 [Fischerella major NIES-592]